MHLRARYYAPQRGQFITRDPFPGLLTHPATQAPYPYALNNPLRYTDPSGENPLFLLAGGLGGLIGGTVYGYGSQVIRNFNQGVCFRDAFTTDIDAGQIALFAGVGTLLGTGMGGGLMGIQTLAAYLRVGTSIGTILGAYGATNEIKAVIQSFGNLTQAARYGIQHASQLRHAISGTGLQVHHIIEQRFASTLGQSAAQARQWLSVAVTRQEHQLFTSQWKKVIGYIGSTNPLNTATASIDEIWEAAQKIYKNHPALLDAARKTLGIP